MAETVAAEMTNCSTCSKSLTWRDAGKETCRNCRTRALERRSSGRDRFIPARLWAVERARQQRDTAAAPRRGKKNRRPERQAVRTEAA